MSKWLHIVFINAVLLCSIWFFASYMGRKDAISMYQNEQEAIRLAYKQGYDEAKRLTLEEQRTSLYEITSTEQGKILLKRRFLDIIAYAPNFCDEHGYVLSDSYMKNYNTVYKVYIAESVKEYEKLPKEVKSVLRETDDVNQKESFTKFYINDFNASKDSMRIKTIKEYCQIIDDNSEMFLIGTLDLLNELLLDQSEVF